MTRRELEQYKPLTREIKNLDLRIAALEAKEGAEVFDTVKGSDPEFPHVEKRYIVNGTVFNDIRTADLKRILEMRRLRAYGLMCAIEVFLCGIDDSEARQIIEYKYIDCLKWDEVAAKISPYATADSVRMKAERYLKTA